MIKITEEIKQISGIETDPFLRFSYIIPLEDLIELLVESRDDGHRKGYENLKLHVSEDDGIVDMSIYGDRNLNAKEIKIADEISVIARMKPLSNEGLDRDDILQRNAGLSKYLVRPHDFHIFELDETNDCYRSWSTREVLRSDGTRINANPHFTYETLTVYHDFFPISEDEIPLYDAKNNDYCKFTSWQHRSDGHGGCKGGTYEEFLAKH